MIPKFNTTFFTQLKYLTARTLKQQRGERLTATAALLQFAYLFFTAFFWWRVGNTTSSVFSRNSLLFFMIIAQSNGIVTSSVTIFQQERSMVRRERAKKMYGVSPFFLGKVVSDLSNNVLLPLLYGMVVYWTAGLRPDAASYFKFILTFYLTLSTAQSMGLWLGILIPRPRMALALAPPITLFTMILGGFYLPLDEINVGIRWATWLSFARYGYSALVINEYEGRFIECSAEGESISIGSNSGECPMPGEDVMESLGITGVSQNFWFNVGMAVALQVVFRFAAYVTLRRDKK